MNYVYLLVNSDALDRDSPFKPTISHIGIGAVSKGIVKFSPCLDRKFLEVVQLHELMILEGRKESHKKEKEFNVFAE